VSEGVIGWIHSTILKVMTQVSVQRNSTILLNQESYVLDIIPFILAHLTMGNIHLPPTNTVERLCSIVVLMIGLIFNSTIVSLLSSQVMECVISHQQQTQQLKLCEGLKQNSVYRMLVVRVERHFIDRTLSPLIRSELRHETRIPHLLGNGLFNVWASVDFSAIQALCDEAVRFCRGLPRMWFSIRQ
jgi:hypothetical protein